MSFEIGIEGVVVGHSTNRADGTGCTVIVVPGGAVASLDVRGGAPGTRESDILSPYSSVGELHAVLLTGGSAFGLAAADGVVAYLEEQGHGYQTPFGRVPLVAAAVIYDLGLGYAHIRPRMEDGYRAAAGASALVEEGCVGVGTGATVGKILGDEGWMKAGFAATGVRLPSEASVCAFTVVNAFGDVVAEDGSVLAGALVDYVGGEPGVAPTCFLDTHAYLMTLRDHPRFNANAEHTTLSVVVTDAALSKIECSQVARMAHDGLARAISPVHTPVDGDAIFVLSTGSAPSNVFQLGTAAADAVAAGIRRAVRLAEGLHGVPSLQDLRGGGRVRLLKTKGEVRRAVAAARAAAEATTARDEDGVGLVPTMGYLHEGHLSLARRARQENALVVMSIFVNPTQFGPNEDLSHYPRDLERDLFLAEEEGVDLVFHPPPEEMYLPGHATWVDVEGLTEHLCGASRPGHFRG